MIDSTELLKKKSQNVKSALSASEIDAYVAALKGWAYEDNHIVKSFVFKDYYQTIAFVNAVAFVANSENHHPDLLVSFNRCVVMLNTHSVGGVSENDFICAAKIDAVASHTFVPIEH